MTHRSKCLLSQASLVLNLQSLWNNLIPPSTVNHSSALQLLLIPTLYTFKTDLLFSILCVYLLRSVPKFMKRMKGPDYKDKVVFGVPLIVHVQRYGYPLPLSLQLALRFLRSQCLDQVHSFIHICKIDYKVR